MTTYGPEVAEEQAYTAAGADPMTQCPYCKKDDFKGERGVKSHLAFCPDFMLGEGPATTDAAGEAYLTQPAAILADPSPVSFRVEHPDPAPLPISIRDPASAAFNHTHAWYFWVPEEVDITGLSTTGMPNDVFHSTSSWKQHQVQERKDAEFLLVCPVERHGLKVAGSPYVHLLPPDVEVWGEIVARWRRIIPYELEIEKDLLEQAEIDLGRAQDRDDRADSRARIRLFSTRVQQMATMDFDRLFDFFRQEHTYSRLTARSSAQTTIDLVNETVDSRIPAGFADRFFEEDQGEFEGKSE